MIFSQVHYEKSDQLVTSVNYYMYFAHLTNVPWGPLVDASAVPAEGHEDE